MRKALDGIAFKTYCRATRTFRRKLTMKLKMRLKMCLLRFVPLLPLVRRKQLGECCGLLSE